MPNVRSCIDAAWRERRERVEGITSEVTTKRRGLVVQEEEVRVGYWMSTRQGTKRHFENRTI